MEQSTINIIKLIAAEGMTLTNGDAFGKEIYLGVNDAPENWWEITDEEAKELQNKEDGVDVPFEQGGNENGLD